ncbi:MAG TPA: MFS transporter, partial [Candidatus Tetragenococcus pullicola]|nr:MFS transporter [Candidatus Tetragenococcus pullicola]
SIAGFFTYGCPILLAPLATPVIKKFGKKEACSATLLISSFIFFALYFLHITNSWVYLVLMFLGTISYYFFNLMVWALISDVIDYHQYVSGYREDGTIYALNSFARKVGQAIAGGLTGFLLQLIGYQTSTTGGVAQTAAVNERIYAISNLMPAILLLIGGLILIFIYNLDKKRLQEVEQVLNEINKQ